MKTNTKKKALFATIALPGLLFAGTTVAGAQDAADDADTGADDAVREHPGRRGPGHGIRQLVEALDMEPSEIREALEGGATIADLATQQGVDIDSVIDEMVAEAEARAAENPDSPRAQNFDAAELEQRLTDIVNGDAELPERGERGHRGGPGGFGPMNLAETLDMEPSEIREALEGGATIADLATQQGVDIDSVIDQIVADAEAKVAENPDSPRAENFDAAELEQRLTDIVNGDAELPQRGDRGPRGHRGPGGPGGFGGPQGEAPADAPAGADA